MSSIQEWKFKAFRAANQSPWEDSGIVVEPGDNLTISAAQDPDDPVQIQNVAGPLAGPQGSESDLKIASNPIPDATTHQLIARVGTEDPFEVGRFCTHTHPVSGQRGNLYFALNDYQYTDNHGAFDVKVAINDSDLLAHYPLRSDYAEASGRLADMTNYGQGFRPEGGVEISDDLNYTQYPTTPGVTGFDIQSFTISVDFLVDERRWMPVFVLSTNWRLLGFYITADGGTQLLYNNSQEETCSTNVSYQPGEWHTATATYDGTKGSLFLDGQLTCNTDFSIDTDRRAAKNVVFNNPGGGPEFKGVARDLRIYKGVKAP